MYRNTAVFLCGMMVFFAALAAAITGSIGAIKDGNTLMVVILSSLGTFLVLFISFTLSLMRRHRWTIEADALLIEERPLVRFTGPRRSARVKFGDIAALARVQNGVEDMIEMRAQGGATYRLSPAAHSTPALARFDSRGLEDFADQLRAAMVAAGHAAPPLTDGLGFWNRAPGFAVLGVLLVLTLGLSGVVLFALFGGVTTSGKQGGEAAAIVVALPLGVAWMLRRSWRRRRAILAQLR